MNGTPEEQMEKNRSSFLSKYATQLTDPNTRKKYLLDYEFPKKQQYLVSNWDRWLNLFFRNIQIAGIVEFVELTGFFSIDNIQPIGLKNILAELASSKKFVLLTNEFDWTPLRELIDPPRASLLGKFKNLFVKPSVPSNFQFVVHAETFKRVYEDIKRSIESLFYEKAVLSQSDLTTELTQKHKLSEAELRIYLGVLHQQNFLASRKDRMATFYYLHSQENPLHVDHGIRSYHLQRQVSIHRTELANINDKIEEVRFKAFQMKKKNRKAEALDLLRQVEFLRTRARKLEQNAVLMNDMVVKLAGAADDREIARLLQLSSKFIRNQEGVTDKIIEELDNMREVDQNNQAVIDKLNENAQDVEQMYNELDVNSPPAISHPEVIETKVVDKDAGQKRLVGKRTKISSQNFDLAEFEK